MKPVERSLPRPAPNDAQRRWQNGPLQPMAREDIFEGLFARLLRKVGL